MRIVYSVTKNLRLPKLDLEDLNQELCLLYLILKKDCPGKSEGYYRVCLQNYIYDYLNSQKQPVVDYIDEPKTDQYNKILAEQLLDCLPKKYRVFVEYYFFNDKTMTQIGEILGVKQPRVTQIIQKSLKIMRDFSDGKIKKVIFFSPKLKKR